MKNIVLIIFSLFSLRANAQKYDNSWMFGYDGLGSTLTDSFALTKINFETNPITLDSFERDFMFYFTNTSISDPTTGGLQFYTNGISVRDKTHSIMQNGDSINYGTNTWINTRVGGYRALWGALALPYPNHPNQYYLVHQRLKSGVPWFANLPMDFMYTKIDMTLNSGKGRVIIKNQSMLHDSLGGLLSATKHANGRDWWIIQEAVRQNKSYIFLLDPTGLHFNHTQNIGTANYVGYAPEGGFFSPDGSRFAYYEPEVAIYLYDFDRCTGLLSNLKVLSFTPTGNFGSICFSPNSQYLYFSHMETLSQYDLNAPNIAASKDTVAVYDGFTHGNNPTKFLSMQIAPNGKIYIAGFGALGYLHIIDEPNIRGLGCHVIQHGLKLRGYSINSMPNFPNYRLGALAGSGCDTLQGVATSPENTQKEQFLTVFPNPVNDILNIEIPPNAVSLQYKLYDILGKEVQSGVISLPIGGAGGGSQNQLSLKNRTNGIYFLHILDKNGSDAYRAVRLAVQHE